LGCPGGRAPAGRGRRPGPGPAPPLRPRHRRPVAAAPGSPLASTPRGRAVAAPGAAPVAALTVLNLSADVFLAYAVTRGDLAVLGTLVASAAQAAA
jgi:hypothetical protein